MDPISRLAAGVGLLLAVFFTALIVRGHVFAEVPIEENEQVVAQRTAQLAQAAKEARDGLVSLRRARHHNVRTNAQAEASDAVALRAWHTTRQQRHAWERVVEIVNGAVASDLSPGVLMSLDASCTDTRATVRDYHAAMRAPGADLHAIELGFRQLLNDDIAVIADEMRQSLGDKGAALEPWYDELVGTYLVSCLADLGSME